MSPSTFFGTGIQRKDKILSAFTDSDLRISLPPWILTGIAFSSERASITCQRVAFVLLSRIMEKRVKEEMTIEKISETMEKLQIAPVVIPEGTIMIRTESEEAEALLSRFGIPMPVRIMGMDTNQI